ncbi:MAG: hypothetical protein JSU86_08140, partial [Phycisphaerales bacterium]
RISSFHRIGMMPRLHPVASSAAAISGPSSQIVMLVDTFVHELNRPGGILEAPAAENPRSLSTSSLR